MPSSAVRTFVDADNCAAAIRQGTVELTVTGRGRFEAKLTRIDLHRLWMQRFFESCVSRRAYDEQAARAEQPQARVQQLHARQGAPSNLARPNRLERPAAAGA